MLARSVIRTAQPQAAVRLKGYWVNKGLQSFWAPGVLYTVQASRVVTGTGTKAVSHVGTGVAFNGTSQSISLGPNALSHGKGARIALVRVGSAVGARAISGGGNNATTLRLNGTTIELITSGVAVALSASAAVVAGELCTVAVSDTPLNLGIFKNGNLLARSTTLTTGSAINNQDSIGQTGVASNFYDGTIFAHASFASHLSDEDHFRLAQNPWQLLEDRSIWIPVGAASAGGVHSSSGGLASGPALIAGVATRTRLHGAAGVLAAGAATIAGSSTRAAGRVATGALAAASAAISGVAARFRAHASTGTLASGSAQVTGAADLIVPGGTHASSGALASGTAAVSGVALLRKTHAAVGALVSDPASIVGLALRGGEPEPVTIPTPPNVYFNWWRSAASRWSN